MLLRSFCFVALLLSMATVQASLDTALNLRQADLAATIQSLSHQLGEKIILSPAVRGTINLNVKHMKPQDAFDLLLKHQGLQKTKVGEFWWIAPKKKFKAMQTYIWSVKYGRAEEMADLLRHGEDSFLSKEGILQVDKRTNCLVVYDYTSRLKRIEELLKRLDVPTKQIFIKARIASVDYDYERELGVTFSHQQKIRLKSSAPSLNNMPLNTLRLADSSLLDVRLSALEQAGHAELISRPSLLTLNQQTATIESGEEVPYQEVSDNGGTAIAFKKAVLSLNVTPYILADNAVLLNLQMNQDRPSHRTIQGMPTIVTRRIVTKARVKSGETLVLGGIYETGNEHIQKALPFLSQIPLLGVLFKAQNRRINKRELLIFVTPTIIEDNE